MYSLIPAGPVQQEVSCAPAGYAQLKVFSAPATQIKVSSGPAGSAQLEISVLALVPPSSKSLVPSLTSPTSSSKIT